MKLRMEMKKMLKSIKEMLWEEEAMGVCETCIEELTVCVVTVIEYGFGCGPLVDACCSGKM